MAVRETQLCKHDKEHEKLVGKGQEEDQEERERETGRHGPDEIRAKPCVLLGTGRQAERKREETKDTDHTRLRRQKGACLERQEDEQKDRQR